MESLRQSGAKISPQRRVRRNLQELASDTNPKAGLRVVRDGTVGFGVRAKAITKEMVPFRTSLSRTAAAGEYAFDAGVDMRE